MIERYQIFQEVPGWLEAHTVTDFNQIIENWDSGKTYVVTLTSQDGTFHHTVVLNTSAEKPVKNADGMYELAIYDPNYPAFTDKVDYNMVSSGQRTLLYTQDKAETGQKYFEIYSSENTDETSKKRIGSDINFLDISDAPLTFDGSCSLLSKEQLYISFQLKDDTPYWIYVLKSLGYHYTSDTIQDLEKLEKWYVEYMASGDGGTEVRIYPNCSIEEMDAVLADMEIEISDGVVFSYAGGD